MDNLINIEYISSRENKLSTIMAGINLLASKYADQIGWTRGTDALQECLHCTQGCHYNRFPEIKAKFWKDVWKLLKQYGIDPKPIQETMANKLAVKPWTTTMAHEPEDLKQWIKEQL